MDGIGLGIPLGRNSSVDVTFVCVSQGRRSTYGVIDTGTTSIQCNGHGLTFDWNVSRESNGHFQTFFLLLSLFLVHDFGCVFP